MEKCQVPYGGFFLTHTVDISLQSGRFWATPIASFSEWLLDFAGPVGYSSRSTRVSRWYPPVIHWEAAY